MKITLICGARPNFVKIAPIMRAIDKRNASGKATSIQAILIHTGQHYDYEMSQVFFEDLQLPEPYVHLGIGSGTHAEQTGKALIDIEKVLMREKPDVVVVVGDVNSTLAGALAAVKLHIPVAHVEAGIRSYDRSMPEEVNRLLVDHISDYLFTTSRYDDDNLRNEGIGTNRVFCVGNVTADSLLYCKESAKTSNVLFRLGLRERSYALVTLHRPSNVDQKDRLSDISDALVQISQKLPVVFPIHPRTHKNLKEFGLLPQSPMASDQLLVTNPLGYLDFLNLEMNAKMVITDSGGIQVETTILGVPCLTVLDSAVWPITHEQGTNILLGSNCERLLEEVSNILDGRSKKGSIPELWDGKTGGRIVDMLTSLLSLDKGEDC